MKRIFLSAMASALAVSGAAPAQAAVFIGIGFNGGKVTQAGTNSMGGVASYLGSNGNLSTATSAMGAGLLQQPALVTQAMGVQLPTGTGGTLNLYITQTDLSAFTGTLTSSFTSNLVSNATAVARSYYSTSNELFGGTQLASANLNGLSAFSFGNAISAVLPYSTTVRYDITFGPGAGSFNGTANLVSAVAVPEPATWAMMLLGFGGFGYAMRRRQNAGARIRFV